MTSVTGLNCLDYFYLFLFIDTRELFVLYRCDNFLGHSLLKDFIFEIKLLLIDFSWLSRSLDLLLGR